MEAVRVWPGLVERIKKAAMSMEAKSIAGDQGLGDMSRLIKDSHRTMVRIVTAFNHNGSNIKVALRLFTRVVIHVQPVILRPWLVTTTLAYAAATI